MSLYDRFNRRIHYLRISVTDLCNLRCTYCMPADGVDLMRHDEILSFEEITEFTRIAVAMGVDKVRLTGGEPLVRRGIVDLVTMIGRIPGIRDYTMTTNGVLLPTYARDLKDAGIDRINISLDTLDPDRYRSITRVGSLDEVLAGIRAARALGFKQIKINCVIDTSPEEADAQGVAAYGQEQGLEVRFIRKMDTASGKFWRVMGGDGGHCQSCNRLRLSANGNLYPCLFSDQVFNIRTLGTTQAIERAAHAKAESGHKSNHQFYQIGG